MFMNFKDFDIFFITHLEKSYFLIKTIKKWSWLLTSIPWDNRNEHCVSLADSLGKLNFFVILKPDWITFVHLHERMAFQHAKTGGANCLLKAGTECISSESFSSAWFSLLSTCSFFSEWKLCCAQAVCDPLVVYVGYHYRVVRTEQDMLPLQVWREGPECQKNCHHFQAIDTPVLLQDWPGADRWSAHAQSSLTCVWSCLPWLPFSWRPASNLFLSGTDERLSKGQGLDIAVGSWGVPSVGQDLGFQQVKQAHSLLS